MTAMRSFAMLIDCLLMCQAFTNAQPGMGQESSETKVFPVEPNCVMATAPAKVFWGDDVRVTNAGVYSRSVGQLRCVADTLGGIYVAVNEVYEDTLSLIMVYRSTDDGQTWDQINGFRFAGVPVASFDMCIADSSAGRWLLGFAIVTKREASSKYENGGTLYWGSMLSDGSHWQYKSIASMTTSRRYRQASICTNAGGAGVASTRFFIAAVQVSRDSGVGVGVYVNSSSDWGHTWADPDTSIRGEYIAHPDIVVDWGTTPDSLCIAYQHWIDSQNRSQIFVARNTQSYSSAWGKMQLLSPTDDDVPCLEVNQLNGDMIVTYHRMTYNEYFVSLWDLMYCYSGNQFRSYARDSIATTPSDEMYCSLSWSHVGSIYYWRVAYDSRVGFRDTVYAKSLVGRIDGFHDSKPTRVSQFGVSYDLPPAATSFRESGGTHSRMCCIYVDESKQNVYFDAASLTLDVPQSDGVPTACTLEQNWPNPFNPVTSIGYSVGEPGSRQQAVGNRVVKLAVFDLLGREVAVLVDEQKQPGEYTATWDATGMPSGVYFYRLIAAGATETKKMLLLR